MKVTSITFYPSTKANVLAECKFQLTTEDGEFLLVDRARVLHNKQGELWLALPTYSVPVGRAYEYHPTVTVSTKLRRLIEDAVLPAYEKWAAAQGVGHVG
jgi:DNA-binding cell septation regulator SpoVG